MGRGGNIHNYSEIMWLSDERVKQIMGYIDRKSIDRYFERF